MNEHQSNFDKALDEIRREVFVRSGRYKLTSFQICLILNILEQEITWKEK